MDAKRASEAAEASEGLGEIGLQVGRVIAYFEVNTAERKRVTDASSG